jgi:hypothetical protein
MWSTDKKKQKVKEQPKQEAKKSKALKAKIEENKDNLIFSIQFILELRNSRLIKK